jgi:hypothetical protein
MGKWYVSRKGKMILGKSEFRRRSLPYGLWRCADGREVLFDRDYTPICQRYPGQAATMADGHEWVPWKHQEWFYNDTARPQRLRRSQAVLKDWQMTDQVMKAIDEAPVVRVQSQPIARLRAGLAR